MSKSRWYAFKVLNDTLYKGVMINDALSHHQQLAADVRDQSFSRALCYGVLRWHERLEVLLSLLLKKPLRKKDQDIHVILLMGLYQLAYQHSANHAAVSETVNLTRKLKKKWAASLINGVLRQFQREQEKLSAQADKNLNAVYSHPDWLLNKIRNDWPDDWQNILMANNAAPPMTLRLRGTTADWQDTLAEFKKHKLEYEQHAFPSSAVTLTKPIPVDLIPGFQEGKVTVQDAAAQIAATLLAPHQGNRILDACAAPGGKTAHLIDTQPALKSMLAIDPSPKRIERLKDTLNRLGLSANLMQADASDLDSWWDKELFDRILLDAPCSSTGVIRRHPDIKRHRNVLQISEICKIQKQLLNKLWLTLVEGGRLLYATCSILQEENQMQISEFLNEHTDAKLIEVSSDWANSREYGYQILPGNNGMDGFFLALLEKQTD